MCVCVVKLRTALSYLLTKTGHSTESDLHSTETDLVKGHQNCFVQLRLLIRSDHSFLSVVSDKVIHAFIWSRLDCCTVVNSGIRRRNIQRLQFIQNAASRLLREATGSQQYTPTLQCLPVSLQLILSFYCLFLRP